MVRNLSPGALVVLESTTYPGITREVLLPIFEQGGERRRSFVFEQGKLHVGEDFYLAFSPERKPLPPAPPVAARDPRDVLELQAHVLEPEVRHGWYA
ncbi:MAG: hypothetical protein WKF67_14195 [Rubrobacteraceae bacterium]